MQKLIVVIDADVIPGQYFGMIVSNLEKIGILNSITAYGDFRRNWLDNWKNILPNNGLTLILKQVNGGKENADKQIVIDMMDQLYSGADSFCIVSCDSYFTPLAIRLRDSLKSRKCRVCAVFCEFFKLATILVFF